MSTKISKLNCAFVYSKRALSAKAAPKMAERIEGNSALALKQTKLPNGLVVVAADNEHPIARVGVYVRAGARFEASHNLGVTHCIRNAAGMSSTRSSFFAITRKQEHYGGFMTATSTREDIIYKMGNMRDFTLDHLVYLADTATRPAFKPWEISDFKYRMQMDCERQKLNREALLIEALHKVAFRGGLSNSLLTPDYMMGKHDHNMLMEYVNDYFVSKQIVVVGLGIENEVLVDLVQKNFKMNGGEAKPAPSKFISGETRINDNSDICLASVVTEGVSTKNLKDVMCLSLFQQLLGCGPRIKYNHGVSWLEQAAAKASQLPTVVSGLNISYSDTGLFGFVVAGAADDMNQIVKSLVSKMKEASKGLKEEDINRGKYLLRSSVFQCLESHDALLDEIASHAFNGQLLNLQEIDSAIESITLKDVSAVVSKVMKGKVAMASIGKLHNMPYLEDISA